MKPIKNLTPHFYGYDNYPRNKEGKILLDRADDGRIVIKRANTLSFGSGLLALCDGAKISEEDWKDLRRGFYMEESDGTRKYHYCVGGSDAGAVSGISPYSTALDIYNAKKGLSANEDTLPDSTDFMFKYGHMVEPLFAEGFSARTKLEVFKNDSVFFNEDLGFMQANVDYFVKEPNGGISILEIKSTAQNSTTDQLAKDGKVPDTYYTQAVLHYPMTLSPAFNIVGTYFCVGTGNILDSLNFCRYARNPAAEKELLQKEQEFVDRLINDNPPRDTSTPEQRLERSGLKQVKAKPIAVELSDAAKAAVIEYEALSTEEKRIASELEPIKKRKAELQAIICEQLGDAAASTPFIHNGKELAVKWGNTKRQTINKEVLRLNFPDAYAFPGVVGETESRRFTLSAKEVDNDDQG